MAPAVHRMLFATSATLAVLQPGTALAQPDLASLSIEELANIEVTSASKREEPLSTVPTSLFVITDDAITSSAATSLPEVLRLAPNLQVQQLDAYQYAVTARGFNGIETANKLLVLIDGRTVYTPLQSQVYWALHSPLLEDLQQIEVISGPGGTLYGPNAVNGVVNIVSRNAQETIGTLLRATAGPQERTAAARHGFALGTAGAVRFYANYFDREDRADAIGFDVNDAFRGWQAGFRADIATERDSFTLQGDLLRNDVDSQPVDGHEGHNLLARWSRTLSPNASFQVQGYYDQFRRRFILVEDSLETFDVEAQLNYNAGRHQLVAGAGVRTTRDEFINNLNQFQLDPPSERLWVYNVFVQDRFALSDHLSVIAGVKIERSSFTGFHVLPNLRVAYQPDERSLWWAAVSRAVRTPSRIDRQLSALPLLAPATEFRSEKLIAFEAGYRGQPLPRTSVSVSAFFNLYDDIRTTELSPTGGLPIRLANSLAGHTYGVEAWATADPLPGWRLSLGAATIWKNFDVDEGHRDLANGAALGDDPNWQLLARSQFDLGARVSLTVGARAVGEIETAPAIPAYVQGDARLAWRVTDALELYVAGENIFDETHIESNDTNRGQLAQRSLYAGTRVRF